MPTVRQTTQIDTGKTLLLVFLEVNRQSCYAGVMTLSDQFAVPTDAALLYDFVNSLDQRHYRENGTAHLASDALSSPTKLEMWLEAHSLPIAKSGASHGRVLLLRDVIRSFLKVAPADRSAAQGAVLRLKEISEEFPLLIDFDESCRLTLRPAKETNGIGQVLVQLHRLSASGQLNRLKMCASGDCNWVFFDRSKPGNRRWCSSARCGNRHKTRAYRERQRISDA